VTLKNPFKLNKLKINAYSTSQRRGQPQESFTVMFNPASFAMHHENVFQKQQGINTSGRQALYSHTQASTLHLDLVLDGTGVVEGTSIKSVAAQIQDLLKLCFYMDGRIHEPKYLKIQWGEGALKDFDCRLQAVDIEYTAFDRNGAPLHATLKTTFVADLDPAKRVRQEGKNSPDLSHSRVVKAGDTLPLLAKEIYGSAHYYLRVAQANHLDDFRNLTPGQTLIFPPLEK
jgi:nucleoid-associated protein YgaU